MVTASTCFRELFIDAAGGYDPARRDECLRWGDDYELLFAVPESQLPAFDGDCGLLQIAVTKIGVIEAGYGVSILTPDGVPIAPTSTGFDHFRRA